MRFGSLVLVLTLGLSAIAHAQVKIENNQLVLSAPIVFETGSDRLKSESDSALDQVKRFLDEKSYVTLLRVEQHSDSTGAEAFNQKLTEDRARAVARWLAQHGIACDRLIAVGFGSTKPVAPNDTAEHKAQNRRTVLAIAALRGRALGGMPVDGGGKVASGHCPK